MAHSKKTLTYCYFATFYGKIVSDEFATRQEVAENMNDRGYASWEYDILCLCEEWDDDSPLRKGYGSTQREARANLY